MFYTRHAKIQQRFYFVFTARETWEFAIFISSSRINYTVEVAEREENAHGVQVLY